MRAGPLLLLQRAASWTASQTVVHRSPKPVVLPPPDQLVFGKILTNNMFKCEWTEKEGWHTPTISETTDLRLSPAASVLHYAIECFEGMKAYLDAEGRVRLFRPDMNAKRMQTSCKRISLPSFDTEEFVGAIKQLVTVEKDWIPKGKGYSLYIRPTCISTHTTLGIAPPEAALFYVICSPVGPYYKGGFKPIKLLVNEAYSRAWKGGTGQFKLGANYGPTILPQVEAAKAGYSQLLWLNNGVVTEVGSMNLAVYWKNRDGEAEVITAPLSEGTVLPGVTRDTTLQLLREWGYRVREDVYTIQDFIDAHREGRILEVFGTGTAAIMSQVSHISYQGVEYGIPTPATAKDSVAMRLMEEILAIQYGERGDHPWSVVV
jgi:branched-chain amino acid aminotransferase